MGHRVRIFLKNSDRLDASVSCVAPLPARPFLNLCCGDSRPFQQICSKDTRCWSNEDRFITFSTFDTSLNELDTDGAANTYCMVETAQHDHRVIEPNLLTSTSTSTDRWRAIHRGYAGLIRGGPKGCPKCPRTEQKHQPSKNRMRNLSKSSCILSLRVTTFRANACDRYCIAWVGDNSKLTILYHFDHKFSHGFPLPNLA
jgi:hypothetical protein